MKLKRLAFHFYHSSLGIAVEIAYGLILILAAFAISFLVQAIR